MYTLIRGTISPLLPEWLNFPNLIAMFLTTTKMGWIMLPIPFFYFELDVAIFFQEYFCYILNPTNIQHFINFIHPQVSWIKVVGMLHRKLHHNVTTVWSPFSEKNNRWNNVIIFKISTNLSLFSPIQFFFTICLLWKLPINFC